MTQGPGLQDRRDRRRRPCGLSACGFAAPARLCRAHRAGKRRRPSAVPAAASVQGLSEGHRRARQPDVPAGKILSRPEDRSDLRSRGRRSIAARTNCCSPPAPRSITAIWCWRPARAIACSIFPTPISTACAICGRSTKARRLRHRIAIRPARRRDRRRLHRAGIRRDRAGQGP